MEKYIEVNIKILSENIKNIIKTQQYKYYIATVKCNAYGHGFDIINTLIDSGINYLAVVSLDEAVEIRKRNKDIPILCLNTIDLTDIDKVKENNITLTISSIDYYDKLCALGLDNIKVHIKVETGLNRFGFQDKDEINRVYNSILEDNNFILEGLFTHLSSSIYPDQKYYDQIDKFKELTQSLDYNKINIIHIFKSNTAYFLDKLHFCNGVRLGISMYGVLPEENAGEKLNINTAFKFKSKVIEVKEIKKDSYVGYNNKYKVEEDSYLAVVPVGYGDGLHLTNDGNYVVINNTKYKTIGGVNMNSITVLADERVSFGDEVVIIDNINDYAKYNNISAHMVFTMLDSSIPKIYLDN